jgi:hypothetical protein
LRLDELPNIIIGTSDVAYFTLLFSINKTVLVSELSYPTYHENQNPFIPVPMLPMLPMLPRLPVRNLRILALLKIRVLMLKHIKNLSPVAKRRIDNPEIITI